MDKNKIIEAAAKLVAKGAYDKAIKEYQKVLEVDPKDIRVLQKMGELFQKKNDNAQAAHYFTKVAESYSSDGFFLKAVALYKQVLKLNPSLIEVNLKLAELHQQLGLMSEAMAYFQIVANAHDKAGDTKSSLDTLKKMVDLDPDNVASRIKLAELYAREQMTAQALEEFHHAADYLKKNNRGDDYLRVAERLAALEPDNVGLNKELAQKYLAAGDQKRALARLQVCFKADPRDVETLTLLAQAFLGLGQNAKTLSVYKELAKIHQEKGQGSQAQEVWKKVGELDPSDADYLARKGGTAAPAPSNAPPQSRPAPRQEARPEPQQQQSPQRAAPQAQAPAPAPAQPPPPAAAGGAGKDQLAKLLTETDVYVKYGLHDKALEHLRKIFAADPENLDAHEKAYHIYVSANNGHQASEQLLNVLRLCTRRGDVQRGQPYLAAILQSNPNHPEVPAFLQVLRSGAAVPETAAHADSVSDDAILVDSNDEEIIVAEEPEDALAGHDDDLALSSAAESDGDQVVEDEVVEEQVVEEDEEPAVVEDEEEAVVQDEVVEEEIVEDESVHVDATAEHHRSNFELQDEALEDVTRPTLTLDPALQPRPAAGDDDESEVIVEDDSLGEAQPEDYDEHTSVGGPLPFETRSDDRFDPETVPPELGAEVPTRVNPAMMDPPPDVTEPRLVRPQPIPETTVKVPPAAKQVPAKAPEPIAAKPAAKPAPVAAKPAPRPAVVPIREPEPEPEAAEEPASEELDEAGFFLDQGLVEEAREILETVAIAYPGHARAAELMERLEQMEQTGVTAPPADPVPEEEAVPHVNPVAPEEAAEVAAEASAEGGKDAFDLAAELADELGESGAEVSNSGAALPGSDEFQYSVEEVFSEFKKGLEKVVKPEDVETHYDLGIAYKEMGLVDDAIGEFAVARQGCAGKKKEVDCLTMMGVLQVSKGDPAAAVGTFREALASEHATGEVAKNLQYELATALEATGELGKALYHFQAVAKADPTYRDVKACVDRLSGQASPEPDPIARASSGPGGGNGAGGPKNGSGVGGNGAAGGPKGGGPSAAGVPAQPQAAAGGKTRKVGYV